MITKVSMSDAVYKRSGVNESVRNVSFAGMGVSVKYLGNVKNDMFSSSIQKGAKNVLEEVRLRMNNKGQFLAWFKLPEKQLNEWGTARIFKAVQELKATDPNRQLTVIGIGGSKHTLEYVIGTGDLPGRNKIHFYSDIDPISLSRLKKELGGRFRNSNYEVVSKSGTTFEPEDALVNINRELVNEYIASGKTKEEAQNLANKHFVAVTDANPEKSKLRRTAKERGYVGQDLCVHDDVGGRFSALDDHGLFAMIYAGASKEYIERTLKGAVEMTKSALDSDLERNIPMQRAMFYTSSMKQGIVDFTQNLFSDSLKTIKNWHLQMHSESLKDNRLTVKVCPEGMHYGAEADFDPRNKYNITNTVFNSLGIKGFKNANEYSNSIANTYSEHGPTSIEMLDIEGNGLAPETIGAYAQMKHFETIYKGMLRREVVSQYQLPKKADLSEAIPEVLQPSVEIYKNKLKVAGKSVVTPGLTD